ncbi:MAG: glycosyltransferase family 9 protein [Desulfovibrio sp.]|nr:glycosyltransferase family 9 protein [Desulfovibrio sp.]
MAERGNKLNRFLDRWAGIPLTLCSAGLRAAMGTSALAAPARVQSVGFLCLGAIGDLLLFSSVIAGLRKHLPDARFYLLTTKGNASTVPLIPGIDESAAFGVRQVPAMLSWLREKRLDVLIDSSQWPRLGAVLSNLSGANRTVGFETSGQCRAYGYSYKVPHRADRHEVENFVALGRSLFPDMEAAPGLALPQEPPVDAAQADAMLESMAGARLPRIYLHMWPSGIHAWLKEWPAEYWAFLAKRLYELGFQVCLTGAPGDAQRNVAFLEAHADCPAVSLAGKLSLPALAWMFSRGAAVVSVNTGTMHLAALAGAPTVGLHGPTNPMRWGAWGKATKSLLPHTGACAYLNLGFEYPRPLESCMGGLPVEDVLNALKQLGVYQSRCES